MTKFQRTPEYVDAFQMTAETQANQETWPDWAIKNRSLDQRAIGAIFPTDYSENQETKTGFSIRSEYGEFQVPIGSWVVKADRGYMIIEDQHFQTGFVKVESQNIAHEKSASESIPKEAAKAATSKEKSPSAA